MSVEYPPGSDECDYYLFPIRNEHGFRVTSGAAYDQLMYHIMHATAELQEDYPDKQILVTFLAEPEGV